MNKTNMVSLFMILISSIAWLQCDNPASIVNSKEVIEVSVNQEVRSAEVVGDRQVTNPRVKEITKEQNESNTHEGGDNQEIEVVNKEALKKSGATQEKIKVKEGVESIPLVRAVLSAEKTVDKSLPNEDVTSDKNQAGTERIKEELKKDIEQKKTKQVEVSESLGADPQLTPSENKLEAKSQQVFSHETWDALLRANVTDNGKVNYAAIKSDIKKLDDYLRLLSDNTPQSNWSSNKTKAYWINVYNAFTIKLIVDNYPLSSIMDLHGGKPWDKKWIKLGGKTYSLNDVEHVILRPTYKDARIHFAVNCAAKSCPKVWNRAWTENNVEGALDKLTKEFVSNTVANQISEKSISLSKIFDWYGEDFGDLISFLNKYSKTKISSNAKIAFNDYNWKLNS